MVHSWIYHSLISSAMSFNLDRSWYDDNNYRRSWKCKITISLYRYHSRLATKQHEKMYSFAGIEYLIVYPARTVVFYAVEYDLVLIGLIRNKQSTVEGDAVGEIFLCREEDERESNWYEDDNSGCHQLSSWNGRRTVKLSFLYFTGGGWRKSRIVPCSGRGRLHW